MQLIKEKSNWMPKLLSNLQYEMHAGNQPLIKS
jgi:hypothetical protein